MASAPQRAKTLRADVLGLVTRPPHVPFSSGSLGAPTQTTQLGGSSNGETFAFTKIMTDLCATPSTNGDAFEYAHPTGGTPISTIAIGNGAGRGPYGTAVIPTQYPSNRH